MNESQRLQRLTDAIAGSGARVCDPYGIEAHSSNLADDHMTRLSGWADLQFLVATRTKITDESLPIICSFSRLTDLGLGGNDLTDLALAMCHFPRTLTNISLYEINLSDDSVDRVADCPMLEAVNVNHSCISFDALVRLASLPNVEVIEAIPAATTPEIERRGLSEISRSIAEPN